MSGEELKQISMAVLGAVRFKTNMGLMVPAEMVVSIMNTHCAEVQAEVVEAADGRISLRLKERVAHAG